MTEIDFAYLNYAHGGLAGGEDRFYGAGRGYGFAGLALAACPGDGGRLRAAGRPADRTRDPGADPGRGLRLPRPGDGAMKAMTPGHAGTGDPARLPAVIAHLYAICKGKQGRGVTVDVRTAGQGGYELAVCQDSKEITATFGRRRRRWDLTGLRLTDNGEPVDIARNLAEVLRLLGSHETGTEAPARVRAASTARNSTVDVKKKTVLRVCPRMPDPYSPPWKGLCC